MKKRRVIKKRKVNFIRLTTVCVFVVAVLVFVLITSHGGVKTSAVEYAGEKCYKSIMVEKGDTLWSIAGEYYVASQGSINDFVEELKSINGLNNEAITYGANLIVPYYSN